MDDGRLRRSTPGSIDRNHVPFEKRSLPYAVTATQLARTAGSVVDAEEIEDKETEA